MAMNDCGACGTKITSLRDGLVHIDPAALNDHQAEPKGWKRNEDVAHDQYGPRWPRPSAGVQLSGDFYGRGCSWLPPDHRPIR